MNLFFPSRPLSLIMLLAVAATSSVDACVKYASEVNCTRSGGLGWSKKSHKESLFLFFPIHDASPCTRQDYVQHHTIAE